MAGATILNGKRKDQIRCVMEDMTKFHITRNGWTAIAVEEEDGLQVWWRGQTNLEGMEPNSCQSGSNLTCESRR